MFQLIVVNYGPVHYQPLIITYGYLNGDHLT